MKSIFDRIYAASEPYWQTRENHVHVPNAYRLAQRLLEHYPEADPEIVLPAILMHDNGYKLVPEETHLQGLAGAPIGWKPDITRLHEQAGAKLAGEILAALNYDPAKTRVIQEIVDGHDSRTHAVSLEDAIVKDADKLWRFTRPGIETARRWMQRPLDEYLAFLESKIETWFLTEHGRRLAHELLAESRRAYAEETPPGG